MPLVHCLPSLVCLATKLPKGAMKLPKGVMKLPYNVPEKCHQIWRQMCRSVVHQRCIKGAKFGAKGASGVHQRCIGIHIAIALAPMPDTNYYIYYF